VTAQLLLRIRARLLFAAVVAFAFVGCPCMREPVNASPSLRWWLFSNFGANRLCPEMLQRSAPLRIAPNPNVVGRLFPEQCQATVNDTSQTITLAFSGAGLVWTPVAGRVAFNVAASVEYKMDFFMAEDAVYIWARPARVVTEPAFQVTSVEARLLDAAAQGPLGYIANGLGGQIVSGQLASGFTVVHEEDGDSFALGQLSPPARPPRAFAGASGRRMLASEVADVHQDQIDFLGPFVVEQAEQALYVQFSVTGPGVDLLLIPRGTGDLWRRGLALGTPLGPPPQPPIFTLAVVPGQALVQRVPLPAGHYYFVVDHSARMGSTNPPFSPFGVIGGNLAAVAYAVELGEADE